MALGIAICKMLVFRFCGFLPKPQDSINKMGRAFWLGDSEEKKKVLTIKMEELCTLISKGVRSETPKEIIYGASGIVPFG